MYLTDRDKNILRFVEQYKSITINQCSKIFFNNCKYNYYQARKRLKLLADNKFLKRYRKDMRSETIYYLEKKLSVHDLKVLDVYAELLHVGADINYFRTEYAVPTKKKNYRVDGLIEFIYNDYFFPMIIEVDYTHFTSEKKLFDIYNSNYFQEHYKKYDDNIFPTVLILRVVIPPKPFKTNLFNIYFLDFSLSNFKQVLL